MRDTSSLTQSSTVSESARIDNAVRRRGRKVEERVEVIHMRTDAIGNKTTASATPVDDFFDRALAEFDSNPQCRILLGRLAKNWPSEFAAAAITALGAGGDSPALRCIALCVVSEDPVCELIADPKLPCGQAIEAFKQLQKADPLLDTRLAKRLPDATGANYMTAFDTDKSLRALEILDQASSGRRLLNLVGHLTNSADTRIAAKAAKFLGKRIQKTEWVARQLERKDPRIRASAVESLWGIDSTAAKELLRKCRDDPSNRVVGNAVVGLHMLKDPETADNVMHMAMMSETQFRATAAWSIGQIGDPSLMPAMQALAYDPDERVRKAVAKGLKQMPVHDHVAAIGGTPPVMQTIAEEQKADAGEVENVPTGLPVQQPEIGPIDIRLDGKAFAALPTVAPEDSSASRLTRWSLLQRKRRE